MLDLFSYSILNVIVNVTLLSNVYMVKHDKWKRRGKRGEKGSFDMPWCTQAARARKELKIRDRRVAADYATDKEARQNSWNMYSQGSRMTLASYPVPSSAGW